MEEFSALAPMAEAQNNASKLEGLFAFWPIAGAAMKRGGWKHSQETRDKIAATMRERRDEIAEATKARMADPAVRQRIRDGMLKASASADELRTLRAVWRATPPTVRTRFLAELLDPICRADQPQRIVLSRHNSSDREGDQS